MNIKDKDTFFKNKSIVFELICFQAVFNVTVMTVFNVQYFRICLADAVCIVLSSQLKIRKGSWNFMIK